MGSDTRLNYFKDVEENGVRYQKISATADCIRKTFFISKAGIGINFVGIGYFEDEELNNNQRYPLSHFINKLDQHNFSNDNIEKFQYLYQYFNRISVVGDTGQYIKGVMTNLTNDSSYICTFNTFNNSFELSEFQIGDFIDSENNNNPFPLNSDEIKLEINKRISQKSIEKQYQIGGPVEIIELLSDRTFQFLQESDCIFEGTQSDLFNNFNTNLGLIRGVKIDPPVLIEYDL